MLQPTLALTGNHELVTRRHFLASTGAATLGATAFSPALIRGADAGQKVNIGLIGAGGRGQWIAGLFVKDGGYQIAAVADYFQERADSAGQKFNIPSARRFTGLHGYRSLLEQPLDAVVIESPPYFHPEHAAAAVEAGKHVYLAKPIAVDVPGCQTISESGRKATVKKQVFLVDFQTRANAAYQEAARHVQAGDLGKIVSAEATYYCGPTWGAMDPILARDPTNVENRLHAWGVDRVLSGDVITEQNIHALDVACWMVNTAPIKAYGAGGKARDFVGDCWDHFSVIYYFPNNVLVTFASKQVGAGYDDICCRVFGTKGTVDTHYAGRVATVSNEIKIIKNSGNLYTDGAVANIASFRKAIAGGDFSNPTVQPGVRSNLTTILGRTAAYRNGLVTWDEMMRTAEKWEADLTGAKT